MDNVIVVGAGPTGLWLACELRLAGVEVTLIERQSGPRPNTRGLGTHARTLEMLAMRGLVDVPLATGRVVPRWHFGMLPSLADYSGLDTPYPFVLAYPQNALEEFLDARAVELGATILRGTSVAGLTQSPTGVRVQLADGTELTASWVVGADGAGSTVRKAAGIAFPGTDATYWGYVADVTLTGPPPARAIASVGGALITAPLPSGGFRVSGFDPHDQHPEQEMTLERVSASVNRAAGRDLGLTDPIWISQFGNATRRAAEYRAGRVFVAGDAAHMHPPTGGVGLNVGIQDAMNLGWKLAAVATGRAPESLLDTYHDERAPVGTAVLENTRAQSALVNAFTPEGQALRAHLSGLIDRHPAVAADLARSVSGLDVAYPSPDPDAHPLTGSRFADATAFPLFATGRPVLVRYPSAPPITPPGGIGVHDSASTSDDVTYALIRPDGYIWWATTSPDPDAALAAIKTLV
ncbi:FAD-dependent monooxygenase [Catenuloplanes sp. NPDC051500]|uniref:FAD-dependent monooxygenase n=1 Tax=Catenuloplanes sp. NPDC051500 TaxID=3363959 RepID=UPI00378F1F39